MKKLMMIAAAAGLLLAMASGASAFPVQFDHISVGPKQNIQVNHPFASGLTYQVGINTVSLDLLDDDGPQLKSAFCIDLRQGVSSSVETYDLTVLGDAPLDGGSPYSPMGTMKADAIGELWGEHFDEIDGRSAYAAAFQLAIWEIIFENAPGASPNAWDVTSGNVLMQSGTTAGIANGFLATLLDGDATLATNLMAVTNAADNQDFVVQFGSGGSTPVPEPFTLVTGFMGLCGLGSYVRRRTVA